VIAKRHVATLIEFVARMALYRTLSESVTKASVAVAVSAEEVVLVGSEGDKVEEGEPRGGSEDAIELDLNLL
jgi:hypothetical protein